MKKILLHDQQFAIGGPKAALDGIVNSYLGEKYNFVRIYQTEACGFNPIKAIMFVNKYRKMINKENADVIYICGLLYVGFLITLSARLSNVKRIVLSVHGSEWDSPNKSFRKWVLKHFIEPWEIRMADSVFTVCEAAQNTILPLKNKKNNIGVIYNTFPNYNTSALEVGKFRKDLSIGKDKIIVSTVGRVVEDKGHQYIIDAMKKMTNDDFVFVIVGDGPYLDVYKNICQQEIKDGRLFLLGRRMDVNQILKDTDIFLFPTLHENHSIALLEAVNMNCAVICTKVGGNPEIIEDGVSGLLIPPHNSEAIVQSLELLKNKALRQRYSQMAFDLCKDKFSMQNTYGKLERLFG